MGKSAFTLIEIIVAIAIISILAAIAIPRFLNARILAQISREQEDLTAISKSLIMYETDNASIPTSVDPVNGFIISHFARLKPLTTPVLYMNILPMDIFRPEVPPSYLERCGWKKTSHYAIDFPGGLDISFFHTHSWVLSSVGPAKSRPDMSNGYGDEDRYDMSNGLYSLGSIISVY